MITKIINFLKKIFSLNSDNVVQSDSVPCVMSYGAFKDCKDSRDYIKEIESGIEKKYTNLLDGIKLKASYQGTTNACTGHAMAAFLTILYSKLNKENLLSFNPYYIYYWNRMLAYGSVSSDKGCYLRETMRAVQKYGALTNELCSLNSVYKKPKITEQSKAHLINIKNYFRLPSDNIYNSYVYTLVKERLPILTALYVKRADWEAARKNGILKNYYPNHSSVGGHAICVYGYDPSDDTFLAINSWGELWGNKGHFKITKSYLESNIMDAWTVEYNYF